MINPINEKHANEAALADLTFLGKSTKGKNYRLYRFNACAHEADIQTVRVRKNRLNCMCCIVEKIQNEAAHADLTLLGKSQRGKDYRLYIFNQCGHEADLQIVHVRKNQVTCKTCVMQKRAKEAQAVGLTLIGSGHNKDYKLYRFAACGHETELQISHVRNNSFVCNVCEETSRTQPSYTYLIKITVGEVSWLKYGYAKSIDFRTKQYGLPEAAVVKLLAHECFATGNEAHAHESSIHAQLGKHKLSARKMKKYHTKNGQTECYPMLLLHEFLNTFK